MRFFGFNVFSNSDVKPQGLLVASVHGHRVLIHDAETYAKYRDHYTIKNLTQDGYHPFDDLPPGVEYADAKRRVNIYIGEEQVRSRELLRTREIKAIVLSKLEEVTECQVILGTVTTLVGDIFGGIEMVRCNRTETVREMTLRFKGKEYR